MYKLPKKVIGTETQVEGYKLTCKLTGEEYNGQPSMAWFHENGEQAFRSINGEITFLEPNKPVQENMKNVSEDFVHKYAEVVSEEQQIFNCAWNIAKGRYPEMNDTRDTFGQIVNSIGVRLIAIKQLYNK